MKTEASKADDTRALILGAAMTRILHYGYGKTTMAEIARDCDMSAGNIYRFFASKLDIAEALAWKKHSILLEQLEAIASDTSRSAIDRLRAFLAKQLDYSHALLSEDDKILEVAEVLNRERPEFVREESASQRMQMEKILAAGVANGEFHALESVEETANTIQTATMKFCYPQVFSTTPLDRLEAELASVTDLIIAGLKA